MCFFSSSQLKCLGNVSRLCLSGSGRRTAVVIRGGVKGLFLQLAPGCRMDVAPAAANSLQQLSNFTLGPKVSGMWSLPPPQGLPV